VTCPASKWAWIMSAGRSSPRTRRRSPWRRGGRWLSSCRPSACAPASVNSQMSWSVSTPSSIVVFGRQGASSELLKARTSSGVTKAGEKGDTPALQDRVMPPTWLRASALQPGASARHSNPPSTSDVTRRNCSSWLKLLIRSTMSVAPAAITSRSLAMHRSGEP